jgi:Ca2+-binding RTX toxin-like protein
VITGNTASNRLFGLDGNDTLLAGAGNDTQTGGIGADHFVFNSAASGTDTIADFNALDGGAAEGDLLEFVGLRHGTFHYQGSAAFTGGGVNTEARVVGSVVQMDFNGDGKSDLSITLTGLVDAAQLTVSDFLFT